MAPLVEKYFEYLNKLKTGEETDNSWDGFYDYADIHPDHRTDFASAAILNQVKEVN